MQHNHPTQNETKDEAMAGYRIPDELVQAFREAARQLEDWTWIGREPVIRLDQEDCRSYRTIGSIANYASIFNDPTPDDIYTSLCRLASRPRH